MSAASGSVLLRVATADAAAMFSLNALADKFKEVGVSFVFFTLRVTAFSNVKPPASVVLILML